MFAAAGDRTPLLWLACQEEAGQCQCSPGARFNHYGCCYLRSIYRKYIPASMVIRNDLEFRWREWSLAYIPGGRIRALGGEVTPAGVFDVQVDMCTISLTRCKGGGGRGLRFKPIPRKYTVTVPQRYASVLLHRKEIFFLLFPGYLS